MANDKTLHPALHELGQVGQHDAGTKHGHLRNVHAHLHAMSTKDLRQLHKDVHRHSRPKHELVEHLGGVQTERKEKLDKHLSGKGQITLD